MARQVSWLLVVPALMVALAVHFVAPGVGAWYAFTDWNGLGPAKWIGLGNFREIFRTPETRTALYNTLKLAFGVLVLVNVIGLSLALGLNRLLKTRNLLRSLFFLPVVMSPLAVAFIWQYIFDYHGPLEPAARRLGLSSWQQPWLGRSRLGVLDDPRRAGLAVLRACDGDLPRWAPGDPRRARRGGDGRRRARVDALPAGTLPAARAGDHDQRDACR